MSHSPRRTRDVWEMLRVQVVVMAAAVWLLTAAATFAQSSAGGGSIQGTVNDEAGRRFQRESADHESSDRPHAEPCNQRVRFLRHASLSIGK